MKEIESLIVNDCMNNDKCTGMLLLATLYYLKEKYKEVVTLAQKVVKKLKWSVIYHGLFFRIYKKQTYMDEVGGKGLTLYQKFNRDIFACTYICRVDCNFYPLEIEQELIRHSIGNEVDINPFVYSYVLMFLSYLHMSSRQNMVDTLSELYSTVKERISDDEFETPLNNSLVEKCIHLSESWHYSRTKS